MNYVLGGSPFDFKNSIMTILENYPKPSVDVLMNSISTHDIERAINILGGESCEGKSKDWMCSHWLTNEEFELGRNRLREYLVFTTATKQVSKAIKTRLTDAATLGEKKTPSLLNIQNCFLK